MPQSLEAPSKPRWAREVMLPATPSLQVALSWGAAGPQGQGWLDGVWGNPFSIQSPLGASCAP